MNTIDAQVAVGVHVTGTPVVKLKLELKQAMKAIARSPIENFKLFCVLFSLSKIYFSNCFFK